MPPHEHSQRARKCDRLVPDGTCAVVDSRRLGRPWMLVSKHEHDEMSVFVRAVRALHAPEALIGSRASAPYY